MKDNNKIQITVKGGVVVEVEWIENNTNNPDKPTSIIPLIENENYTIVDLD